MFFYRIYQQIVQSDLPLYNIPETIGSPSIWIRCGEINYQNIPDKQRDFYYSPQYVCFSTPFCSYSIKDGTVITVSPKEGADMNDVTSYLIGWAFAYLFTQRGYSCIHSTALDIHGQGIIISGVSGSGKSTTARSIMQRGYRYLTDDMTIIDPTQSMDILPAYPLQKVCHNLIDNLDQSKLLYINEYREKYAYVDPKTFTDSPIPWSSLFIIRTGDIPQVQIEHVTGLNKYLRVLECLYLIKIYSFKGIPDQDKYRCLKACDKIEVYVITRPNDQNTIDEVTDQILALVDQNS